MSQHILIVEDDVMIQGFLTLTLEGEGFRTSAVGSGSGMFSVLKHEKVDLILLDLGLPDADGLDLTEEIRKTHAVPIIVASARRRSDDRDAALALGANDYLTKPFEPRELIKRVKFFLAEDYANETPPESGSVSGARQATPVPPAMAPQSPSGPGPVGRTDQQPTPARSQPVNQPRSASMKPQELDRVVLLFGVFVVVVALVGGMYWYVDLMGGEPPVADQLSPATTAQKQEITEPRLKNVKDPRRGALQPPASAPVHIAEPPETVSEADTVEPAPGARPIPKATPKNFTESIVVRPQTSVSPKTITDNPSITPAISAPEKAAVVRPRCAQIPDVDWWRFKTHAQVKRYVDRKHGGDWQPYVEGWSTRLEKLRDIYGRGSAIKTGNGELLQDEDLAAYINQVAKRLAVTRCLAEEASTLGN